MSQILDDIKGFGGYTTTATLWIYGLWLLWRGLPGIMEAVNKIIDAIANRQSVVEERMRALLKDADERFAVAIADYERRLQAEIGRHDECMHGQEEMRRVIVALNDKVEGMKRQMGQVGFSTIATRDRPIPGHIVDAAERAAEALDQNEKDRG